MKHVHKSFNTSVYFNLGKLSTPLIYRDSAVASTESRRGDNDINKPLTCKGTRIKAKAQAFFDIARKSYSNFYFMSPQGLSLGDDFLYVAHEIVHYTNAHIVVIINIVETVNFSHKVKLNAVYVISFELLLYVAEKFFSDCRIFVVVRNSVITVLLAVHKTVFLCLVEIAVTYPTGRCVGQMTVVHSEREPGIHTNLSCALNPYSERVNLVLVFCKVVSLNC